MGSLFFPYLEDAMKNVNYWFGMLVTVLALGLVFTGCATASQENAAGGNHESSAKSNVYASMGVANGFTLGAGYERALGDSFSLGVYTGLVASDVPEFDLLIKPRFYFSKSALEKFFIGANIGLNMYDHEYVGIVSDYWGDHIEERYETVLDFVAGLNFGYKFVFGSRSGGFSLEPSIGYDFLPFRINGKYESPGRPFGRVNVGVTFGFSWGGGGAAPVPVPRPVAAPRKTDTGLYLGIIGFNETLSRREIAILNAGNRSQFQQFVTGLRIGPATGLYHAVDNAISMLEAANLPDDLVSVSIVTFTDGLDNASLDLNPNYATRDLFRDGVQNRISNTMIKGLPIDAYSVGIQGGDVRDREAFIAGLRALATVDPKTSERNVSLAENMNAVNEAFGSIAKSLYQRSQLQSIVLRIPGGYDDGDRIRFTFDNVTDTTIGNSNIYIEGTYRRVGSSRSLENVVFRGLNSTSGTRITGEVTGTYVNFTFENVTTDSGVLVDVRNAQQWEYLPSMSLWQRNSEFNPLSDSQTIVKEQSAVIVLVLDCTTSLTAGGADGFEQMKAAANTFLNTLTNN